MAQQTSRSPHIEISLQGSGAAIRQHRPAVLSHLAGMPIDQALGLVPTLLPICGTAQSIAAARAVAAARGERPAPALEQQREREQAREQALSCGWRLSVDWPDLLGEPRDMAWLKQLRNCSDSTDLGDALLTALPGIGEVRAPEDLQAWASQHHCVAARLLARAIAAENSGESHTLGGAELVAAARAALASPGYDPGLPCADAVEVGPLAMARDRLVRQLSVQRVFSAPARRTAALLLDSRYIASAQDAPGANGPTAWPEGERRGSGMAVTARGPVFHRVELDRADRVVQWRALAPTDWHFAGNGPLQAALAACTTLNEIRLVVASFDPCVPCHVNDNREN